MLRKIGRPKLLTLWLQVFVRFHATSHFFILPGNCNVENTDTHTPNHGKPRNPTRSSSREVGIRVLPFFWFVYFGRGTLPTKKESWSKGTMLGDLAKLQAKPSWAFRRNLSCSVPATPGLCKSSRGGGFAALAKTCGLVRSDPFSPKVPWGSHEAPYA